MTVTKTLTDILLTPDRRPQVVTEAQQLLDDEVSSKDGISGLAVKGAYSMVKKVQPGKIHNVVDGLLDGFIGRLEPFYADFQAGGSGESLPQYLVSHGDAVADALLGVTDDRAAVSENTVVKKAYEKLRPSGKKNVEEALPRLGDLIERHVKEAQ